MNLNSTSLRDLPLPVRLVLIVFLGSIGLGYLSAMVQLHFKHAGEGRVMPSVEDVVAKFAGREWPLGSENQIAAEVSTPEPKVDAKPSPKAGDKVAGIKIKSVINARCAWCHGEGGEQEEHKLDSFESIAKYLKPTPEKSLFHKLVSAEPGVNWGKDSSMRSAFTKKSEGWKDLVKERGEEVLSAERDTERLAVIAWLEAGASEASYTADAFALPSEISKNPLAEEFKTEAIASATPAVIKKVAKAKTKRELAQAQQASVESLTQSTHAHALSFSVLWTLTGLVFAFSSWPMWMRCTIAPMVLLAQIADIACWWLARIENIGPYFAVGIMGTGAIVGMGLAAQITLSLLNLIGIKK
jgi:hypothetical protein